MRPGVRCWSTVSSHPMRRRTAGSVSGRCAADGTASAQSPFARGISSGRRVPPPRRALPLRHSYCGLSRQSSLALLSFGLGLVRGVFAGCNQPPLPAGPSRRYLCESFLGCRVPCHGGPTECSCLFLPLCHRPSLNQQKVGFPLRSANTTLRGVVFEAADIPLCSGLRFCLPPRLFLPLHILLQGSRGFYVRAERASLPPHAPDMLTVRIQAIDGTRTFTSLDPRPCRPLPP